MIQRWLFPRSAFGLWLIACLLVLGPAWVWAEDRVEQVRLRANEGQLWLEAQVAFTLSAEMREAATKGVPLYFTADVELYQKRWWWLDKSILEKQRTWKLVFSPLTRQWRVGAGDLLRPADSLEDALLSLHHIRGWSLGPVERFQPGQTYYGRFRLRLDSSLLARPLQVDLFNRANWSLATPWHDFSFSISDAEVQP